MPKSGHRTPTVLCLYVRINGTCTAFWAFPGETHLVHLPLQGHGPVLDPLLLRHLVVEHALQLLQSTRARLKPHLCGVQGLTFFKRENEGTGRGDGEGMETDGNVASTLERQLKLKRVLPLTTRKLMKTVGITVSGQSYQEERFHQALPQCWVTLLAASIWPSAIARASSFGLTILEASW